MRPLFINSVAVCALAKSAFAESAVAECAFTESALAESAAIRSFCSQILGAPCFPRTINYTEIDYEFRYW